MVSKQRHLDDSNYLGAFDKYYSYAKNKNELVVYENFKEALSKYENREVDESSIISVLSKNFILGDKTILNGLYRTPWMSFLDNNRWATHALPSHGNSQYSVPEIAKKLFELLCNEIEVYVGVSTRVGILLSGGMDSRMVAGVLDFLIKTKRVNVTSVTAYTWGNSDSRDVVYSKEIAVRLGWNWKHYIVDVERLWRNMELAADRGCEYSGLHLHAMPDIANDAESEVDVILAGSYGDSVGRAEFSGRHVSKVSSIFKGIPRFSYLVTFNSINNLKLQLNNEVNRYHSLFERSDDYAQHELDRQLHYMRRMLNPCMEVINEKVPLYQAFTSPQVYGFMWSLDTTVRNDNIYKELLFHFKTDLKDIPWARTGKPYGQIGVSADEFKRRHHSYQNYLQVQLHARLLHFVDHHDSAIIDLKRLKQLIKLTYRHQGFNFDYLEAISWCISFVMFENRYSVKSSLARERGKFRSIQLRIDYFLRYYLRKLRSLISN